MKKVMFGMYYEVYGHVVAEVPDDVDEDNIVEYLKENWDEFPLATDAEYVMGSDQLDAECIIFMGSE